MPRATRRFWECFAKLSEDVQKLARKNYALRKANPHQPSLPLKKMGKLWSVRVGLHHRALAAEDDEGFIWGWIGTHAEYERLIK
jgi:hypothetical protein